MYSDVNNNKHIKMHINIPYSGACGFSHDIDLESFSSVAAKKNYYKEK